MLSVLFWILCPAGLIGLIVFPGKHKGALKSSDGARDIAIAALLIAVFCFFAGASIPLFPLGMLVMKYKDKILPKTKKGLLIHIALWIMIGGMSFYALSGLQKLLLARKGLHISDGYSCMPDEDFGRKTAMLEKIYKTECIPWLIFGLSLCMLLLIASRYCGSGNPVTRFCRENCYLITVLLFCRHIFYSVSGSRLITKVMPEHLLILVPFILFALSALLSYLINRVIRSGRKEKGT